MVPINYWAVLVAAVFTMALGFLWYGPVFGKKWAHLAGLNMENMKMNPWNMLIIAVGTLIMAFVLDHALIFASTYMQVSGVAAGLEVGFANWIGFIAPVTVGVVLWEGKSWKLWLINAGYYLVALCGMGIILALWM